MTRRATFRDGIAAERMLAAERRANTCRASVATDVHTWVHCTRPATHVMVPATMPNHRVPVCADHRAAMAADGWLDADDPVRMATTPSTGVPQRRPRAVCAVCNRTRAARVHVDWWTRTDYHTFVAD